MTAKEFFPIDWSTSDFINTDGGIDVDSVLEFAEAYHKAEVEAISDKDIEKEQLGYVEGFEWGAEWVLDKLKGGNDE